ncbi:oxidoreductase [Flavobacterium pectinovorum]|uniref:SDR family NAD(P)-dependent oxidoreductase n=1 Tax=Flavobacterium pectinovorum TaxID=29533 RepID=A0A502EK96_9FLAO|nr:oxidoreductase [Flavobacterium pectinovorum]TPG38128.1 SDR family NAD(P)-dependent oxidoreductase [Flavobacterium pectinovorum]
MDTKKVWFITGASKGLGLSLVNQLLKAGQYVVATSRNIDDLIKVTNSDSENFLPLAVDLKNDKEVEKAISQAVKKFNRIDVVINNAGYGIGGSIEELNDEETRASFDVNVFGTLNVIRNVMPYLRAQKSGHIINISSIAGFTGATGWAVYSASKAAVIGLSEVLAEDVKSFGIKVTVVAPGAFRTNFLKPDSLTLPQNTISEYEEVRNSHARYLKMDGEQIGDPEKAAAAMIAIVAMPEPPLHLLLGNDAYQRANAKIQSLEKEFKQWETITNATSFTN